ncbi:cell division protein FtsZ [Desulfovibrio sp. OttesenSCG-928-M14]|nr:cell division protein FtsZ [Desulfovibrio sp. OttesenSCG-928-M14]
MVNEEYKTHIKVIGVGGGGISAVNHMVASNLQGVTFIAVDTDKQTLSTALCSQAIQLGVSLTNGYGCGACAHTGSEAALENIDEIKAALNGADLALVVAGMSGGAGTGAAPAIAQVAKELGTLTIGVVTKPFFFEGKRRLETAVVGIQALLNVVDSLIIIPCDRLMQLVPKNTTFVDMLKTTNEALHRAVGSITDIFTHRSLVAIDFVDIRAIFEGKGKAAMGFGAASGESRARDAAKRAISSPLLDGSHIANADNVWLYITSNAAITIEEVTEVVTIVHEEAHEDTRILFGTRVDDSVCDELRVTVIALGLIHK